jgi:hypothetical protein
VHLQELLVKIRYENSCSDAAGITPGAYINGSPAGLVLGG